MFTRDGVRGLVCGCVMYVCVVFLRCEIFYVPSLTLILLQLLYRLL
jgi:hypothetical protein